MPWPRFSSPEPSEEPRRTGGSSRMDGRAPEDFEADVEYERGRLHRIERSGAEAYWLEEERCEAPVLPGEVAALPTADRLYDVLAADLVAQALGCVRTFGDFHLALSGGPEAEPFYERLMYDPNCRALPWQKTHLWIVDERRVPFDHELSTFRMIRETIVDHSGIPPEQVHPIFPLSEAPAEAYAAQLQEALSWREKGQDRLDFVLLRLGSDGHTAGLYPRSPLLRDEQGLMGLAHDPTAKPERVTMTLRLINGARFVAVLACGLDRAEVVARVCEGREPLEALPIKGVRPVGGQLKWYLDADAASLCARE